MATRKPAARRLRRRPPASGDTTGATPPVGRWMPALAAAGVLGIVVIAGTSGDDDHADVSPPTSATITDATQSTPSIPPTTSSSVVVQTSPTTTKTSLSRTLGPGMAGEEVKQVQQRLKDLRFDPGDVDGQFGERTRWAVWAFHKLTSDVPYADASATITNDDWQLMQDDLTFAPQRHDYPGGSHMEIYLPRQVAIVFKNDAPVLITHISSGELNADGTPKQFHEKVTIDVDENGRALDEPVTKNITALSKTPGGVFQFSWRYPGKRIGPLGGMWNPVYFNGGIAVHGADNVPDKPASHGCIRIPNFIADYFPSLVRRGDYVYVWGHDGRQPEAYNAREREPSPNQDDPAFTTTTSTTIKPTTTTSTTAQSTPVTTAVPAVTTTTAFTTTSPTPATTTTSTTIGAGA
jgi:L,D-transpeptidase catalytic domain/Putative peptidoglycan binding domain